MGSVPNIEIVGHIPSKHLVKLHTLLLGNITASLVTRVSQCCQRLIPREAPAMSACSWHAPHRWRVPPFLLSWWLLALPPWLLSLPCLFRVSTFLHAEVKYLSQDCAVLPSGLITGPGAVWCSGFMSLIKPPLCGSDNKVHLRWNTMLRAL